MDCFSGYYLDANGYCQQEGCASSDNETCTECIQGYFLTSENLCVVIPANCTNVNDQGNCT